MFLKMIFCYSKYKTFNYKKKKENEFFIIKIFENRVFSNNVIIFTYFFKECFQK